MSWDCTLLRAGSFALDGGAMFGLIPRPLWTRLVEPDEKNRIPLQQNCLLLESGGRLALIECGMGSKFNQKLRDIYALEERTVCDALHEIGCDPADISTVIISHLHFDHAGGLTRWAADGETPELCFPNAEIVSQKIEWEDAVANKTTMHRTYLPENLKPVAERVRLVDGEAEILPGIRSLPVPGHTWGQQAIVVDRAGGGTLCFTSDVLPTANHAGTTYNMAYDVEPYTNMSSKSDLLSRAAAGGWTLALPHEPGEVFVGAEPSSERPGQHVLSPRGL